MALFDPYMEFEIFLGQMTSFHSGCLDSKDILWIKSNKGTFIMPQRKSLGQKNSNSMYGSKSAILAIFQKGPGWPCPDSAALKNPSQDFNFNFVFVFWFL